MQRVLSIAVLAVALGVTAGCVPKRHAHVVPVTIMPEAPNFDGGLTQVVR